METMARYHFAIMKAAAVLLALVLFGCSSAPYEARMSVAEFKENQIPGFISAILPKIRTDFLLDWEVQGVLVSDYDILAGLDLVKFDDIQLDLLSFLSDFIVPFIEQIQKFTEAGQALGRSCSLATGHRSNQIWSEG